MFVSNPLIADFISVGQKLEKLGFIYYQRGVIIIETEVVALKRVNHV